MIARVTSLLFLLLALMLGFLGSALAADDNCMTCHADFEEDDGPAHLISRDIHIQKGLSCVDCHGGDPSLDDMDDVREVKNYRGVPDHGEVPAFCARCHSDPAYMHEHNPSMPTDQLDKFKSSVHGHRLFKSGDSKVANCISCHTVHEIGDGRLPHSSTHPLNLPATCGKCHSDADYMAEYDIPTDQYENFESSVHGIALLENKDLGAPACNDCHGNHGAAPPGISSLSAVCGNCHALEAELFNKSPHRVAYEENDFPMCETCHSNHGIDKPFDGMVGTKEPANCVECHTADDGTTAFVTADSIRASIASLLVARDTAATMLQIAIAKGMLTTDEEFLMKEVNQSVIQTRTQVHSFNADSVAPKASAGIAKADTVRHNSAELIDEYYFRRKGLSWATLFITLLAVALYLKIRRL
jgi:predicted CXXCH cytochrome family protein